MRTKYYGNSFDNLFVSSSTIRETFYGLDGDDVFNFYNGSNAFFFGDFSDRFIGGSGNDLMQNLSAGWNDYTLYSGLSFDGGAGYDTVTYDLTGSLFGVVGDATLTASIDLTQFTTLERSVEHHEFEIDASIAEDIEGTLGVVGGGGDETVKLNFTRAGHTITEFSDIEVSVSLGAGHDRFEFTGERTIMSELKINTGTGNDVVIVNSSATTSPDVSRSMITTGAGNDTVVLEGMHQEIVKTGGGADDIYILSGNFSDRSDVVDTGGGSDEIFLELDEYSKLVRIRDFDVAKDTIIFDDQETRDTTVLFDRVLWENSTDPRLYMDNAAGTLYFGENVLATFDGGVNLTADNFETGTWLF